VQIKEKTKKEICVYVFHVFIDFKGKELSPNYQCLDVIIGFIDTF